MNIEGVCHTNALLPDSLKKKNNKNKKKFPVNI